MKSEAIKIGKIRGSGPLSFRTEKLTPEEMNHHVHVVGASGYGKTVLLSHIIKQSISQGRGLLFIDLKADVETVLGFSKYAIDAGRTQDLQIFSLSQQKMSVPYNPIEEGTATQLRDKIMSALTWSEEYYKNQSASFLLKLLNGLVLLRDEKAKYFGIGEVLKYAKSAAALEELFIEITGMSGEGGKRASTLISECIDLLNERDGFQSLQGLRTQLESLVLSDFGELISSGVGGINFFDAVQSNKITYMFLDSRRYGESSKAVGRFILQDLKAVSAKIDAEIPLASRKPFTVIIDEFADLAQEDFISFLDRARSSRFSVVVAHQEICDLQRISPEFAGRLMGNTSTLYAFLQKRPESAEIISGTAGTRSVWKTTYQTERFGFFEVNSGKGSKREVEEFNIHPNTIKSLGVGRCVCIKKYPRARAYQVAVARG